MGFGFFIYIFCNLQCILVQVRLSCPYHFYSKSISPEQSKLQYHIYYYLFFIIPQPCSYASLLWISLIKSNTHICFKLVNTFHVIYYWTSKNDINKSTHVCRTSVPLFSRPLSFSHLIQHPQSVETIGFSLSQQNVFTHYNEQLSLRKCQ